MAERHPEDAAESRLPDPETTAAPEGERGVSSRKFLGVPAWATAVGFAALAAIMYLLMLALT
jgi:hypothetical protein